MKKKILSLILAGLMMFSASVFVNADYTTDKTQNWRYIVKPGKYDYCAPMPNGLIMVGMPVDPESPSYDPDYNNYNYGLLDRNGKFVADIKYNEINGFNKDGYMRATVFKQGVKDWMFLNEIYDSFLLDKSGKIVSPENASKVTVNDDFCYVETPNKIFIYGDDKMRSASRELIDKEGAHFYGSISKTSWYDFRAVFDDCFVMAGTTQGFDSHVVTQAIVFNWDGTVRYKKQGLDFYSQNFYVTRGGIIFPHENEIKYVDFNGKHLRALPKGSFRLYDSKTYQVIDGIYSYPTDNGKYGILNLYNPEAFKGLTFDEIDGYVQINDISKTLNLKSGGKWGLYSFDGEEILPFDYVKMGDVSEGIIRLQEEGDFGQFLRLANTKGEIVFTSNMYELNWDFSDGFIGYKNRYYDVFPEYGLYGFLDKNFQPAIQLEKGWHIIEGFKDGIAVIGKDDGNEINEIRFIDRNGKVIAPEPGDEWFNCYRYANNNMIAVLTKENTMGKGGVIEYLWNGYPLGDVLYSDITAYINGNAIPTSVINGKTLVVVEDLAKYGFDVIWNSNDRTLRAELNKNKKFNPITTEKDTTHKPGTFKCKYLYTDIKTYLSGEIVESYAINGRTLINFELLAKYGKLTWDGKNREIKLVID